MDIEEINILMLQYKNMHVTNILTIIITIKEMIKIQLID